ncbi:MAG: OmpA family protein [Saprospiraceae bacterium]
MKMLFVVLLLCWYQATLSQNLLPNPSFEERNTCFKYQEPCSPKAWRPTTLKSFRYNEFLGDRHRMKPPDGSRYITLIMHHAARTNDRKFLQAALLCPLIAGKTYHFSLHFKTQYKVVQQFGVYFPQALKMLKNNDALLNVQPQIVFTGDEQMPVNTWQKRSGSFVATGKEQGIIIGNFFDDDESPAKVLKKLSRKQLKANPPPSITYYSFDHLSLTAQDSLIGDCDFEKNLAFLYSDTTRHIFQDQPLTLADLPVLTMMIKDSIPSDTIPTLAIEKPMLIPTIPIAKTFVLPDVRFENNSAVLVEVAYPALQQLLEMLQTNENYRLRIVGHTDNVGLPKRNLVLSQRRANSVAQFLIAEGISASRLEVFGKGASEPIKDNNTEKGRLQNRRVSFYLIK